MATWHATAVVLVLEERECTCGRTYTCPSHKPQLQLDLARQRKLGDIPPGEPLPYWLPRRLKRIRTYTRVCACCWHTDDERQLDFFPRPAPRPQPVVSPAEAKTLKKKRTLAELLAGVTA
jgi:hypothetical protein